MPPLDLKSQIDRFTQPLKPRPVEKTTGILEQAQKAGEQVQEKIGKPLSEGVMQTQKETYDFLSDPIGRYVRPLAEKMGADPTTAAILGGLAGFLLPGGKKMKPDDIKFLADSAKAIKQGSLLQPKEWQIFQDTLKHYGLNVPQTKGGIPNQERAADFILTAQESSMAKDLGSQMSQSLQGGQPRDLIGRFDFKKKTK